MKFYGNLRPESIVKLFCIKMGDTLLLSIIFSINIMWCQHSPESYSAFSSAGSSITLNSFSLNHIQHSHQAVPAFPSIIFSILISWVQHFSQSLSAFSSGGASIPLNHIQHSHQKLKINKSIGFFWHVWIDLVLNKCRCWFKIFFAGPIILLFN